jgi:hypothetical protein
MKNAVEEPHDDKPGILQHIRVITTSVPAERS